MSMPHYVSSAFIPIYCTALSLAILVSSVVASYLKRLYNPTETVTANVQKTGTAALDLIYLLSSLILATLSLVPFFLDKKKHQESELVMGATFIYIFFLTLVSLFAKRYSRQIRFHVQTLLLTVLAVYVYRDVFPLVTFKLRVQDSRRKGLLWIKILIACIVAIVLPLSIPDSDFQSTSGEQKMGINKKSSEQRASLATLITYSYLDNIIYLANQSFNFTIDQLPALNDEDAASHLREKSFPDLDIYLGAKQHHVFFGLVKTFRWELFILTLSNIVQIISSFASPIALNRLLNYMETGGKRALMRPWVWIACLFIGPVTSSMASQWYDYVGARTTVRAEALLTELILEHSLRVRQVDGQEEARDTPLSGRGNIHNLVTIDLENVLAARDFLKVFVETPVQLILCVSFLYVILGWSAFVGLGVIIISLPLPSIVGKLIHRYQTAKMSKTDSRVARVVEALNLMRMVKLLGWEKNMKSKISQERKEELTWAWKLKLVSLTNNIVNFAVPIITLLATYCTYTLVMKEELNASIVFSTVTVIEMFRNQMYLIFNSITAIITGKVSLDRINAFLKNPEVLDRYSLSSYHDSGRVQASPETESIGFQNISFSWCSDQPEEANRHSPSNRGFVLKFEKQVLFKNEAINLIIGPTGSGKTSVLMALLGEMHCVSDNPEAWFNLPREKGVAYAPQQSWIQNDTIKNNILFGSALDEERYNKVIRQCALEHELNSFPANDDTEVGEMGVTLSGGQKARITLARAIYSSAEILLLDDIFAALDAYTAKWIVNNCFLGDLVKGRTVLLVTHYLSLTGPIADRVVYVDLNGNVECKDSLHEASTTEGESSTAQVKVDDLLQETLAASTSDAIPNSSLRDLEIQSGKLTTEEERGEGHIDWSLVLAYFDALGGKYPILFHTVYLSTMFISNAAINLQIWYLGQWASQYEDRPASEVPVLFHLRNYGVLVFLAIFWHIVSQLLFTRGALNASRTIHAQLMDRVFGTTFRWLDTTPKSRIIVRATQDMNVIDGPLYNQISALFDLISFLGIKLAAIVFYSPLFALPGFVLLVVGMGISNMYMKCQMLVKREMSKARSPILAHFGAMISGLASIRAYGAEDRFINESLSRLDRYTRTARTFHNLNCWIVLRLEVLSALYSTSLAAYLFYFTRLDSATTGFSLNMGVGFSMLTLYLVRYLNALEVQSNSLERIDQYLRIEQEETGIGRTRAPPAYWPASGSLHVENLSARYSRDGPTVLHDLSFHIKSGERVGIVGRTGSGKSSLTLALLRAIQTEGEVYYDDLHTSSMSLEALRSKITIIPQVPELLSGTLRYNIDPFEEHDDATLNEALRASGLHSAQEGTDESRLTLDSIIASGGSNISVGQRQMLALARAMIRGSKLLILDEATSAIDHKTDAIIQTSLRNELGKDVTVITVAHRLQTIMDADKIMVLEDGSLVEFDRPRELLNRKSKLSELVENSPEAERNVLFAMAK